MSNRVLQWEGPTDAVAMAQAAQRYRNPFYCVRFGEADVTPLAHTGEAYFISKQDGKPVIGRIYNIKVD